MIALQIDSIKAFMNKLLLQNTFDEYLVSEATITTFTTFTIDGQYYAEFFSSDNDDTASDSGSVSTQSGSQFGSSDTGTHSSPVQQAGWELIKPFCLQIFKGKRLPLSFHIVLQLPPSHVLSLLEENGLNLDPSDIYGLFLNLQYRNEELIVTTGTSLRVFSMDKSLDHAWDNMVQEFLKHEELI